MEFLEALYLNPLLLTALIASLAASVVSGIIGSYVVVKRIVFISGSISHAVLSGIGICLWLERAKGISWIHPLYGALITGIIAALIIGIIHLFYKEREDTVIAALWSIGMAIGVLFISQTPGYNFELNNFLLGNILWVAPDDVYLLLALDLVVILLTLCLHQRFLAICFDEEQAKLQGLKVPLLYLFLLVLASFSIVLLIQIVGIILVMTMLAIPAAIANLFTTKLSWLICLAISLSCLFCFFGMALAYQFDFPPGATIALLSGNFYLLALFFSKKIFRFI